MHTIPGIISPALKNRLITLEQARETKTPVYARSPMYQVLGGKRVDLYFKVAIDSPDAKLPSMVMDELKRGGILKF